MEFFQDKKLEFSRSENGIFKIRIWNFQEYEYGIFKVRKCNFSRLENET
eukprot:07716.XXX_44994_45227_1 [CDS] Oithona nana genome sequencing.